MSITTERETPARVTAARLADTVQRPDAVRFNLRLLDKLVRAHYGSGGGYDDLQAVAARIVRNAEAGTLSDKDSRILGAYGVAVLLECAK